MKNYQKIITQLKGKEKNSSISEKEQFMLKCLELSKTKRVRELKDKYLIRCFAIPESGLHIKHKYSSICTMYSPIISYKNSDSFIETRLGTFNTCNDTIIFIHIDGTTYVTKDWSVFKALQYAGYKRNNDIPIYLAYDEEIVEARYQKKWKSLLEHFS